MATDNQKDNNIIDLAEKRRRQQTLLQKKKGANKKESSKSGERDWRAYVQFIAFLVIFAFLLQLCGL